MRSLIDNTTVQNCFATISVDQAFLHRLLPQSKTMHLKRTIVLAFATLGTLCFPPTSLAQDAVDRLTRKHLQTVRETIEHYAANRKETPRLGVLKEVRANLHVHSELSHDSRGKIDDIVAAAKRAGTEVLMFTEHPSKEKDFYLDGHRSLRDGVLLIPGAEMKGMLVYPTLSLRPFEAADSQETTQIVRNRGGHVFLSHLEERLDWQIQGLTGVEIYNTHADFKKQKRMIESMKNPLWLIKTAELIEKFPQEAFSALQTYPEDYLKRWDELNQVAPHTGVAANDAHQNIGIRIILSEKDTVQVTDALGEELLSLSRLVVAPLINIPKDAKPGDVLLKMQLDPYENSLRHAGTHLLVRELSTQAVFEALEEGRSFVAFDWLADSKSFDVALYTATNADTNSNKDQLKEKQRHEIGSKTQWIQGMHMVGQAPLSGHWRIMRHGEIIAEMDSDHINWEIPQPGNYRVELWLELAGQPHCWILTSPFYIQ